MQLSKLGYYADFVIYPVVMVGLAAATLAAAPPDSVAKWLGAGVAGLLLWTLMEYALHRIALHAFGIFVPMHTRHHQAPLDFVGTPTWMSLAILTAAVWLPTWLGLGAVVAGGLFGGVILGYWWYGIVHHLIHHRATKPMRRYFSGLRAHHLRHHYSPKRGNFGVTTAFWDHVFGTAIDASLGSQRKDAVSS
jgi:sterol desaturase/sphingolipid hydroxylase (fatty acid hydroxylase superfamily)